MHKHILPIFLETKSFQTFHAMSPEDKARPGSRALLEDAMREAYRETDRQLIDWCRDRAIHYSACTAVSVVVHIPTAVLVVAHLGDSHAVLGVRPQHQENRRELTGVQLTREHKPDQPEELERIERNGGSLIYLKSDRPFIRGGDFKRRQHAMQVWGLKVVCCALCFYLNLPLSPFTACFSQLNYSRAFGGKDLKMYGLSCEPSVSTVELCWNGRERGVGSGDAADAANFASQHPAVVLLIGSDGIWDVMRRKWWLVGWLGGLSGLL